MRYCPYIGLPLILSHYTPVPTTESNLPVMMHKYGTKLNNNYFTPSVDNCNTVPNWVPGMFRCCEINAIWYNGYYVGGETLSSYNW